MTISEKAAYLKGMMEGMSFEPTTNEGKLLAVVAPEKAEEALNILRQFPEGRNAAIIGEVSADHPGKVVVRTAFGGSRIASKLAGAQLPRIC